MAFLTMLHPRAQRRKHRSAPTRVLAQQQRAEEVGEPLLVLVRGPLAFGDEKPGPNSLGESDTVPRGAAVQAACERRWA